MKSPDLNRFRVQKITKFETDPPTLRSPFVCCPWFALWLESSSALVRSLSSDCTSAFLTATLVLLPACHSASIPPAFRLHSRSAVPQLLDQIFIFSLSPLFFHAPIFVTLPLIPLALHPKAPVATLLALPPLSGQRAVLTTPLHGDAERFRQESARPQ